MRNDDNLILFLFALIGIPLVIWFYGDQLLGGIQFVDLMVLRTLSILPLFGDYYGNVVNQYSALEPYQLRFQHTWIAGKIAWRPITLFVVTPMMLYWAWRAYKVRSEQSFKKMDKAFLDKHLKTSQTVEGKSRQQWTVRRWFHFYKLHELEWGKAQWHRRIESAFTKQLGKQTGNKEGDALVYEFANFLNKEAITQFGAKSAKLLSPKVAAEESLKHHMFTSTAMVRVLAAYRDQFGVISPNPFRNRLFKQSETVPIWFALNGFYRQTTHIESLAILSHFYEEVAKGERIERPQLHNALEGLEKYRQHHVEVRKLKDLDETPRIREEQEKMRRSEVENTPQPSADERYSPSDQLLN